MLVFSDETSSCTQPQWLLVSCKKLCALVSVRWLLPLDCSCSADSTSLLVCLRSIARKHRTAPVRKVMSCFGHPQYCCCPATAAAAAASTIFCCCCCCSMRSGQSLVVWLQMPPLLAYFCLEFLFCFPRLFSLMVLRRAQRLCSCPSASGLTGAHFLLLGSLALCRTQIKTCESPKGQSSQLVVVRLLGLKRWLL